LRERVEIESLPLRQLLRFPVSIDRYLLRRLQIGAGIVVDAASIAVLRKLRNSLSYSDRPWL
jgi:hypothetical protein